MAQAATAEAPVIIQAPTKPLAHFFCECQRECPGGHRFSLCGAELSGKGMAMPSRSMDLCAMCQSIAEEGIPCRYCGKVN